MEYILIFGLIALIIVVFPLSLLFLMKRIKNLEFLVTAHSHYLDAKVRLSEDREEEFVVLEDSYEYALRRLEPKHRGKMKRELLELKSKLNSPPSDPSS